jgi:hypothetical protein
MLPTMQLISPLIDCVQVDKRDSRWMEMSSTDCRKKNIALTVGRQGRQLKYLICLTEYKAIANEGAGAMADSNI